METEEKSQESTTVLPERPTCSAAVLYGHSSSSQQQQNRDDATVHTQSHHHPHHHHHHHRVSSSTVRNIEIDWREVDPYFSELSDCASFWTLINFTCDVIYSGLFVLFFIMGQDVESMFFEGLLNHINPILIYLILSLIINYGALRSLRCGREKFFLTFSITKALLFPITISLLLYLVFCDVQDYFGTFWVSFVVIVSCYNLTAALGLWSMFTCNRYILVNEAAQKRIRKQAKQQQQRPENNEGDCRCGGNGSSTPVQSASSNNYINIQSGSSSRACSSNMRKIGDSSRANNIILVCKPDNSSSSNNTSNFLTSVNKINNQGSFLSQHGGSYAKKKTINVGNCGGDKPHTSGSARLKVKRNNSSDDDVLSFGEEDEVLQISTVHKVMQEIRLYDTSKTRDSSSHHDHDDLSDDDGDSL